MLKLGTPTKWGEISGITNKEGECYYMIVNDSLDVALIPVDVVEESLKENK